MDEGATREANKKYNSYTAPFPKYEFQFDLLDVASLLRDVRRF